MKVTLPIVFAIAAGLVATPALAEKGKRAEGQANAVFAMATSSQGGVNNSGKDGAAKKKFPPGLVDKCDDPDRPGAQGLERACENQTRSRGAN